MSRLQSLIKLCRAEFFFEKKINNCANTFIQTTKGLLLYQALSKQEIEYGIEHTNLSDSDRGIPPPHLYGLGLLKQR